MKFTGALYSINNCAVMKTLLENSALENSSIVANSLMNRTRKCRGGNSYEKELFFDILDFLKTLLKREKQTAWLDICCGRGEALIEAANILREQNLASNLKIRGIDLAGMFQDFAPELNFLKLIETSFETYKTETHFDLITCVHGLHYIGDKLRFLQKAISMLKPDGIFLANLEPDNFKFANGSSASREVIKTLRNYGFEYNPKKHLLICKGKKKVEFSFQYLGADDHAGANYTKQAVVDSYYREKF